MPKTTKPLSKHSSHANEINTLAHELLEKPEEWMNAPNDQLGGAKPKQLLGTPKEQVLLDLLNGIKYGMFS